MRPFALCLVLCVTSSVLVAQDRVDYETHIQPLLKKRCYSCHGPRRQKGDLRLDLKAEVFSGPRDGWTITPGDGANSEVYERITLPKDHEDVMPLKGKLLTKDEQELVKRWIDQGAEWPGPPSLAANPVDYEKQIQPLLKKRCYSCHGPRRQKGDLRLDLPGEVFKGPRTDWVIVPGDGENSELYERIILPKGHKKVMPLKGKLLTEEQQLLVKRWIDEGANWPGAEIPTDVAEPDPLAMAALEGAAKEAETRAFERVEKAGGLVNRIAASTHAVEVNMSLMGEGATDETVAALSGLEPTLVWLNLARTAITDDGVNALGDFKNLRRLNLSNTKISDAALKTVAGLRNLEYLNLYGTPVTDAGLAHLGSLSNLGKLYLWQTEVTDEGSDALAKKLPNVTINRGTSLKPVSVEKAKKPVNTECPVSGTKASPQFTSAFGDQLVAFCCNKCKAKFDEDPKAYADKLPKPEKKATPVNVKCPVSGAPVKAGFTSEFDGQLVGFCCNKCKAKFDGNPKAFDAKLPKKTAKAKTPVNTKCPVSGAAAKASVTSDFGGKLVAFCCGKCKAKFDENPKAFAAKLK